MVRYIYSTETFKLPPVLENKINELAWQRTVDHNHLWPRRKHVLVS